jgi:hypothetical protein
MSKYIIDKTVCNPLSCVPAILNISTYITANLNLRVHRRPRCMMYVGGILVAHINNGFWMAHK